VPAAGPGPGSPGWGQLDVGREPAFYRQAVTYMLAHPGMTYEAAYDFVSRGGR
jgi:hypothetical protein